MNSDARMDSMMQISINIEKKCCCYFMLAVVTTSLIFLLSFGININNINTRQPFGIESLRSPEISHGVKRDNTSSSSRPIQSRVTDKTPVTRVSHTDIQELKTRKMDTVSNIANQEILNNEDDIFEVTTSYQEHHAKMNSGHGENHVRKTTDEDDVTTKQQEIQKISKNNQSKEKCDGVPTSSSPKEEQEDKTIILHEIKKYYDKLINRFQRVTFLPEYKNPCFQEKGEIKCLPYFYFIGAPKTGTTDLWYNIERHPSVVKRDKEGKWWTKQKKTYWYISNYLNVQSDLVKKTNQSETAKAKLIIGDGSAATLWDNHMILEDSNTINRGELPFVWADVINIIQPKAKFIAMLRNPVERTISSYYAFGEDQSPEDFHSRVGKEIDRFNQCLKTRTLRTCANLAYYPRIQIGVYVAHVKEWLRVYPRRQVMILRTEDWHNRAQQNSLFKIFKFLEIEPVRERQLRPIFKFGEGSHIRNKEQTKKGEQKYGKILEKSIELLRKFYRPYNEQLASLLHNDAFLWTD